MRILFIHQNAPGQFRHLAAHLARQPDTEVAFLGQTTWRPPPGVRAIAYAPPRSPGPETHHYLRRAEGCVRRGQTVARAALRLAETGFSPDIVIGHPGWGELLFLRDALPRTKIISYCEMFYRADGQDTGYVPETAIDLDGRCRLRVWNADLLANLELMDRGLSPTKWQRDQHPALFHPLIDVVHEGVDTAEVAPNAAAAFTVAGGPTFRPGDEVVTYVARNLEPVRGFPLLMRALPELLLRRPAAHVIVCGGDGISYGRPPPGGETWRQAMLKEVAIDPARVHFVGNLPRAAYLALLQVSALHLYLTAPFVLSWSCVEALAAGCLVLASDVPPVREIMRHGVNGFLIDPRDPAALADSAASLLARPQQHVPIRQAARAAAVDGFNLPRCLEAQAQVVAALAGRGPT